MRNLVLKDPVLIGGGAGDGAVVSENIRLAWRQVRAPIVVPLLQAAVYVCAAMSLLLFVERVYMAAVILCVKILRRKRYTKYKLDAMKQELEASNSHPMVLATGLQVIDRSGMRSLVAFRQDHNPSSRRLNRHDPQGDQVPNSFFVSSNLSGNASLSSSSTPTSSPNPTSSGGRSPSCSVTRNSLWFKLDGISASFCFFFKYIGLSPLSFKRCPWIIISVWSRKWDLPHIRSSDSMVTFSKTRGHLDSGGWKDRTTVEDMDLAVRASLRGWKFVFVGDLSRVSVWKKFHVIYAFFFVRKIVAHFVTSIFYCIVIPACVLVPEVHLPKFIAIYVPSTITILNALLLCDL